MKVPLKASEQLFAYGSIVPDTWCTSLNVLLVMTMSGIDEEWQSCVKLLDYGTRAIE